MMENNKNELQNMLAVFNNEQFGELQICTIDGKEYFGATNTAKMLGYANPHDAIGRHCKKNGVVKHEVIDNMGRKQEINLITEGNLYRLIAKSKLSKAEEFESWVFDEVLPSLRKRGVYIMENAKDEVIDNEKLFGKRRIKNTFANAEIHEVEKLYEDCINYINDQYSTKDKIKILQSVYNGLGELNFKLSQDAVRNVGKCYDVSLLQHRVLQDKAKYQNKRNGGIKSSKTKEIDKRGRLIFEQDEIIREQQNKLDFLDPDIEEFTVVPRHGFSVNYMTKTIIDDNGKMKTVTSDEYRRWQNNFPNEIISHEEHIDWDSKIYIWLRFDAIESMDCDNMCKSIIDQIARKYGTDDRNVQIREATINKVVNSYSDGRVYYIIKNVE